MLDWLRYVFLPWSIIRRLEKEREGLLKEKAEALEAADQARAETAHQEAVGKYNLACVILACDNAVLVSSEVMDFVQAAEGFSLDMREVPEGVLASVVFDDGDDGEDADGSEDDPDDDFDDEDDDCCGGDCEGCG